MIIHKPPFVVKVDQRNKPKPRQGMLISPDQHGRMTLAVDDWARDDSLFMPRSKEPWMDQQLHF